MFSNQCLYVFSNFLGNNLISSSFKTDLIAINPLDKDIKDSFEYGTKEATENSLNMTPGQSTEDWDEQVGIMHKKHNTMRETVAKMWGVEEGHNPFRKEEKVPKGHHRMPDGTIMKDSDMDKKEDKTMTGKPMTKVDVDPDVKEKRQR